MEIPNSSPAPLAEPPRVPKVRAVRRTVYEPAIGPRLKLLLFFIFASVAVLGATGAYLVSIRLLEWARAQTYENQFTLGIFMLHVVLGVVLVAPFLIFGITHLVTARNRPNRVAVRLGIALFITSLIVGVTGLALIQLEKLPQLPTGTIGRYIVYWLHLVAPLLAVVLYVLHRRAGPDIQWRWGIGWGAAVGAFIVAMCILHTQDPRKWYVVGPIEGAKYFEPSLTRTADGNFIPAAALMMDDYCMKCHQDIYNDWLHSAHHFSSFNNPPYFKSVKETRQVSMERDGNVRASRWCAGCHDVVPFVSGDFDNPKYDDVNDPTAHAGITCVVCHAITNINSPVGNGAYTIEEPLYYPLTYSKNSLLQWLNNQVVKARPDFHKKTMLKPAVHRSAEFCSTCHKVNIPVEVTHYREFQRGQNHYDTYLLSGVSGVGARSFYYPPKAKTDCAQCHMPPHPSDDFGSHDIDGSGIRKVHHHGFPGANTGLPWLVALEQRYKGDKEGFEQAVKFQSDFLRGTDPDGRDRPVDIDLFALKEEGTIDGGLLAPLRPQLPQLKLGATYLVEVVIRTLNMGHVFPQGTSDSNEIWVDLEARSGDRVLGRNGALSGPGDSGTVDEWSHFVNTLMLDRHGNRIDRRNPQDIFTPLYDHQIPPGAAQVVHYRLEVPKDVKGPVELKVRLRYRKFDYTYMKIVYEKDTGRVPQLPIVDIAEDRVVLPVEGIAGELSPSPAPRKPEWQRWNDYGIGCFLEGGVGSKKGELRQAEKAFQHLLSLNVKDAVPHAYVNLARVYLDEGLLTEAAQALGKATETEPNAPWWTVAWFAGLVSEQTGHLDQAIANFEKILDEQYQPRQRNFDFRRDYIVINELGATLFKRAQQETDDPAKRHEFLRRAVQQYEDTLRIDPEDLDAHFGLNQCYTRLGESLATLPAPAKTIPDEKGLAALADTLTDAKIPREQRLQAAADLGQAVAQFGAQPTLVSRPKLPVLLGLIHQCRPLFDVPDDEELRAAAASVLGQLYRQTHAIYRPDDNAKDWTIRLYRERHPAAAAASQAIVIYPLNRKGAPGL
jgi:tetratricopeptide (TPR) repeat protein